MRRTIVLLAMLGSLSSWACSIPPSHLFDSNKMLVQSTNRIALARATKFIAKETNGLYEFSFETVRKLKGEAPRTFTLVGYHMDKVRGGPGDFAKHLSPEFWAFDGGNSIQPGDCVAHGIFKVGETYLVFLRKKSHFRAQENVVAPDDLWLQVIELLIKSEKESAQ